MPNLCLFQDSGSPSQANAPSPTDPTTVQQWKGTFVGGGHTQWVNGRVHQTGFTTTFPPNTVVRVVGGTSMRQSASAMPDLLPALKTISDAVAQLKNSQQNQSNPMMMMLLPMMMKKKG